MIGISNTATFTRPNDTNQYASGDLVANDVDAADVLPMRFSCGMMGRARCTIKRARVHKSGTTVTAASFILHLFETLPAVANGDNGAFQPTIVTNYLGAIPVDLSSGAAVGSAGAAKHGAPAADINFDVGRENPANRELFGLLAAAGTYTPAASEVFSVTLEYAIQD